MQVGYICIHIYKFKQPFRKDFYNTYYILGTNDKAPVIYRASVSHSNSLK